MMYLFSLFETKTLMNNVRMVELIVNYHEKKSSKKATKY